MSAAVKPTHQEEIFPEQQILGLMLADKKACATVIATCQPGLFRDPFHKRIFEAIKRTADRGQSPTVPEIGAALQDDPAWQAIRPDYLEVLELAAPIIDGVATIISRLRTEYPGEGRTAYHLRSAEAANKTVSRNYLIKGLMAPNELSVIYGEPGSGKSFLGSTMAYSISTGREVFGRRVRAAPVIFAALEGQIGFERRVLALKNRYGPSPDFYWLSQPADLYSAECDVKGLIDAVLKVDARLLMIDTLARAMGGGSENDGRDMGMVIAALDLIRRETGAHVSAIHHCGKDRTRGMRGHSSLLGAVDMALEVVRTEAGARFTQIVKAKDGKDGEQHGFELEVVELGKDEDGDPITSCDVLELAISDMTHRREHKLTKAERGWLTDVMDLFAAPGAVETIPTPGMPPVWALTRHQVRAGLKHKGRFSAEHNAPLTVADRGKLHSALNGLKDKQKIGMTDEFIWLLHDDQ
jgi:hypothetical protein